MENLNNITGELSVHYEGYGFVVPLRPGLADVFIPARFIGDALPGDIVEVKVKPSKRGLYEGVIVRIVQRRLKQIVGRLEQHGKHWLVLSEDQRVKHRLLLAEPPAGFKHGDSVVAAIVGYPKGDQPLLGKVVEKLPGRGGLRSEIEYVIAKHQWPKVFPGEVLKEAEEIKEGTKRGQALLGPLPQKGPGPFWSRKDLRGLPFVTIDGDDAKDFDDAVCAERLEKNRLRVRVAIADVSHYVLPGFSLDKEAFARGTSVYFPGRVLPMLPEILSNDLCSLKPNEDRLALVAEWEMDPQGQVTHETFYPAVFQSQARLTYQIVKKILEDKEKEFLERYRALLPMLEALSEAARRLKEVRKGLGSLDFDLPEPEVVLDFTGGISDIEKAERFWSHQMIEELMIAANEAVARYLTRKKVGCVYRIHEGPDPVKIRSFYQMVQRLGFRGHYPSSISSQHLMKVLEYFKKHPEERLVNTVLLRSMAQAIYSTTNLGHFGLASHCYCHFTSPIRRYPDLLVHRLLKRTWDLGPFDFAQSKPGTRDPLQGKLQEMAEQCSIQERRAMAAEREMLSLHQTLFMENKRDKEFQGVISHVTRFGFFVELLDYFVEGLVPVSELKGDQYLFDEAHLVLKGKQKKRIFKIGERIGVRVGEIQVPERRVYFKLLDTARLSSLR